MTVFPHFSSYFGWHNPGHVFNRPEIQKMDENVNCSKCHTPRMCCYLVHFIRIIYSGGLLKIDFTTSIAHPGSPALEGLHTYYNFFAPTSAL